jgi:hypothetical protein
MSVEEEVVQGEAEELPGSAPAPDDAAAQPVRPLPERATSRELAAGGEVRTAALAAAGGIVAGAATVAAVRAVRNGTAKGKRRPARRSGGRRKPQDRVLASRSFLVDVHLLGR